MEELNKATGFPKVFRPCYEKNSADRVFRISKTLNSRGLDKGATMAYQTLCDDALKNINRKNLTMEHFSGLMASYTEANIPTYSELILGLPGETYESFSKGIETLFEEGQHFALASAVLIGGHHIGGEQTAQVGEAADELGGNALGFATGALALVGKAETGLDLLYKLMI